MDTFHIVAVIAFFGLFLAFLFTVCSGLYLVGAEVYKFTKRGKAALFDEQKEDSPRNLRAACFFFIFIGVLGVGLGTYTWLGQPNSLHQAVPTIVSGLFFLGCAIVVHKKSGNL